ncbi:acetoacetate decarboxylase family protein [Phototrophicus methaneseepsis]|uniref:Acetoacetate decarboxylase family protein n=1 Tax=Phototrophicus methaneseepsis TaxID=2710758 RepID=A0A7S8E7Y0_9CHLR|nr:acetoacetate decarboxylase family protein [Phototrophicus methaneseepsis]QPC81938.1 acetoacetate decarboxylase family protein [Phototrophicus methaneseepsis]
MTENIPYVPAPWSLTGDGYILVYRFSREFALQHGFIPPQQRDTFKGGLGTVMIVNYHSSDVGPYGELLFVPGLFQMDGKSRFSITKIYVSTQISVNNGWENWAIPKERADFDFRQGPARSELISVSLEGTPFFQMQMQPYGPQIPVNTAWLPIKATLGQYKMHTLMLTAPSGKGRVQLAHIRQANINGSSFPDVTPLKPLLALKAADVQLQFPVADVITQPQLAQDTL